MLTITVTLSKTGARGSLSVDPWYCRIDPRVDSGQVEWVLAGNQAKHFGMAIHKTSGLQKWPFAGSPGGKPDKRRVASGRIVQSRLPKLPWKRRYVIRLRGRWAGAGETVDIVLDPDMVIDDGVVIADGRRGTRGTGTR